MYSIYSEGVWSNKENKAGFYKMFNQGVHVHSDIVYNPDKALHLSIDFNVNPGMHCTISQIDGNVISFIDEIRTTTPFNTTNGLCKEFIRKYMSHESGLFIYGDSTSLRMDTRTENGVNDYTIAMGALRQFNPQRRVPTKNPSVVARGNFINSILN